MLNLKVNVIIEINEQNNLKYFFFIIRFKFQVFLLTSLSLKLFLFNLIVSTFVLNLNRK